MIKKFPFEKCTVQILVCQSSQITLSPNYTTASPGCIYLFFYLKQSEAACSMPMSNRNCRLFKDFSTHQRSGNRIRRNKVCKEGDRVSPTLVSIAVTLVQWRCSRLFSSVYSIPVCLVCLVNRRLSLN
ncbi:hypothetical protein TNCV_863151 [Trichonephila clavipes]|nr:hypothetical protein TNCV_863151 [Trichonephila clavipes]